MVFVLEMYYILAFFAESVMKGHDYMFLYVS